MSEPDATRLDPARLAALRETGLLGSAPEEAFDALTRLAARLVGAPAVFVSLVDEDRDFYKSCVGFGEPLATVRELSGTTFCHFAIQNPTPLVIPDTRADPRFRDVPTVESLGVAAYVGVPIRTAEGLTLGSFCAIDFQPRAWTDGEIEILGALGGAVEREIGLRRAARDQAEMARVLREQQAELELQVEEGQALNEELEATTDELQLALRRVEESEARARALLDSAAEGIYGIDAEGRCTFANPAAERLLGYGRGELIGRSMHDLIHHTRADGTPYPAAECPVGHAARGGAGVRLGDERLWRRDGTSFPAEYAASPLAGGEGAVVTFLDIGARRAAEAERTRLATVVESAGDYVGVATLEGEGVYINPAGRRMVGLDAAREARGISVADHFFPEDLPFVRGTIVPATLRDGRWRGEFRFRHFRTGEAIPVLYDSFRVTDPATGRAVALATVTRDLTERERLLREAQQARGDAERANQAKSQFLATMSHEIRTPINAVMGYADLLDAGVAGELSAQQSEYLGRIRRSSQHLLGLVNDVLDLAKIEAGEMTVREEEGSAPAVVGAAVQLVAPQAAARGVELAPAEGCGPEARFRGDEDRVRQIVVNLLSNAVKFTEGGGRVYVRCHVRPDSEALHGGPWLAVEVEDTGVGIAPEQLERVFAPFVQAEEGHTRTRGGTGLGLTISRSLARMMGGDLTVRSSLGRGSCFTLWLPAVERRGAARAPGAADEWPASSRDLPELRRVGGAVAEAAERVEEALLARLRADPGLPVARALDDGVLGDHTGPFVAALGKMLEALAERGAATEDWADSEAILELIATRHGRQRRRLGWPRDALAREYAHLCDLLDEIAAGAEGVPGVVHRLLRRAEAASLAAWGHPPADTTP